MNQRLRKTIEIISFILIVGLSIAIFLMRDKIQNLGNIGYLGVFLLCFLANATVLLPAPSLMIAASSALIMNPLFVAIFAALGSTLGEFVGYAFGTISTDLSSKFQKVIEKYTSKIHNQSLLIFVFAVLPLPIFDVAGIYSGGVKINLVKFFLICFVGKFIKMLLYTRIYDLFDWATSYIPGLGGV